MAADDPTEQPGERGPQVCVVAPSSVLMVEIETAHGASPSERTVGEVHVHQGGQGLWVASMAHTLGARVVVCGPFGGETGAILRQLATAEGLEVQAIDSDSNGALVHDRRSGHREEIAMMPAGPLRRHAADEFFGRALVAGAEADVCVLTGSKPADLLPEGFLKRLAHDLIAPGARVVADLSGHTARDVASRGPALLKMADDEVVDTGLAEENTVESLRDAASQLAAQGVGTVVISRAGDPTLVVREQAAWAVCTPPLSTVDPKGAGDSMTAGMAVGMGRGLEVLDAVRLGAAAGTLNVTRRGLGTGNRGEIERFTRQIEVKELD